MLESLQLFLIATYPAIVQLVHYCLSLEPSFIAKVSVPSCLFQFQNSLIPYKQRFNLEMKMFLIPKEVVAVVAVAVAVVFIAAAATVDVLFVFEVFPDLFNDDNVEEDNILALLWSLFLGDPGMVVVVVLLLVNIIDDVSNVGVIQDAVIAAFDVEVVVMAVIVPAFVAFVIVPLNGSIVVPAAVTVVSVVVVFAVAFLSLFLITADLTRIFEIDISLNDYSYDCPKMRASYCT